MTKEKYKTTELEIIRFRAGDLITTSECVDDESRYETSRIL